MDSLRMRPRYSTLLTVSEIERTRPRACYGHLIDKQTLAGVVRIWKGMAARSVDWHT